jgi:hypothetical protein
MKNLLLSLITITVVHFSYLFAWEIVSEMPFPVYGGEAIVHNSQIYIIGGYSDSLNEALDIIQIYDPQENSWSIAEQSLNMARYGHSGCVYSGQLYIFGGGWNNDTDDNFAMEKWDFGFNLFIYDYRYAFNRIFSTSVLVDNDLYIFGGYPNYSVANSDSSLPYLSKYNILTATISDSFPVNSNYPDYLPFGQMSAVVDNTILLFGGEFDGVLSSICRFNINDKSWETIGDLLEPRAAGEAVYINNGLIVLIGGYNEYSGIESYTDGLLPLEVYDYYHQASSSQNEERHYLNYSRSELMAVVYEDSIYVFGGKNEANFSVKQVEKICLSFLNFPTAVVANKYSKSLPASFQLNNYPNPFNASTMIEFTITERSNITLEIFSITGRLVKSIVNKELTKGSYRFSWEAVDNMNYPVASGIYICKITGNYKSEARRLLLVR